MSTTRDDLEAGPALASTIHEVQGVFADDSTMQDALSELTLAGYDGADFSLPEDQPAGDVVTPS